MFIAGQIGIAPEEQYAQALRNIVAVIAAEGGTPADIVKLNSYLVRPMERERVRAIRESILGDIAPAATLVYVPRLTTEALFVEVEAVAVRR